MSNRSRRAHLNQRVSGVAAKLDDHKLALGLVVAAIGAFLGYIAFVSTTGPPFQSRYEVQVQVPADAPPLRTGQEVRIAGKLAGLISGVENDPETDSTLVTANITKGQFRPIGEDATANVRVHSIVYRTYLEIYPGDTSEPMASGGTIEESLVTSGVDLLEVVQLFDEDAREALRESLVNTGFGVAGRGDALNEAFADLAPTSENLKLQLEAATRDRGALAEIVSSGARLTDALRGERGDDVAALIGSGSSVFGALANRSDELGSAIRLLPPFEAQFLRTAPLADPLLDDLAATAVELEPAVAGLNAALPEINRLLSLGDELRTETARIAKVANPVLRTTKPLIRDIYPTVAALDPLITDVDTIVDGITPYADDISRAGTGLAEATSVRFPVGQGAGANAPVGRVIPILTCHSQRNPFPGPGEALEDVGSC